MVRGSTRKNPKDQEIRHANVRQRYDLTYPPAFAPARPSRNIQINARSQRDAAQGVSSPLMFQYKIDYAIEIAGGIRITPRF
jgi:hypothetical protein